MDVCEINANLESKSSDLKMLRAHGKRDQFDIIINSVT